MFVSFYEEILLTIKHCFWIEMKVTEGIEMWSPIKNATQKDGNATSET